MSPVVSPSEASEMTETEAFSALMERLRSGEDAASREVFHRYAGRLVAMASRQFSRQLAHRVDPEDVVQSAFKSFFGRHRDGAIRVGDWDGLWGLLALITLRKCVDRVKYLRARRRDVGREVSTPDGIEPPWRLALSREPRPEEAADLAEAVEHLYRAIGDDDRPILEMSLQGYSSAEIGVKTGRAIRSVQRLREQVRKRLERQAADAWAGG